MSTIYYIKLAANLTNRKISYHAHWNGKEFRASGCYQVGLYAEGWQDEKLLKAEFIKTYQTSAFNALQTT